MKDITISAVVISTPGDSDVLRSVERAVPHPAPGRVLVRNRATGVNFVDALIRRGQVPPALLQAHRLLESGAVMGELVLRHY